MVSFIRKTFGSILTSDEVNDYQIAIENTDADLVAHLADESNPHAVDKTDVGLGNVDNTSDANKPISTATQTALDGKSNTGHTHTAANITDFDTEVSNNTDVAANTADRHAHSNLAVLNATTASFLTADETKLDGIEASADVTDAGNVGSSINGAAAKTTPVDADTMPLIDSAASNVLKKVTWANIKATLKTYFDTLYATAASLTSHTSNTSNPHSVTKSQVGLGNVPNIDLTKAQITFVFDGGGAQIPTAQQEVQRVPYNCTVVGWTFLGDVSGSIVSDIWRNTYANYPPTDPSSITASTPPTISSSNKGQSTTLAGWTTTLVEGDILKANVDSATTITHAVLALHVVRT